MTAIQLTHKLLEMMSNDVIDLEAEVLTPDGLPIYLKRDEHHRVYITDENPRQEEARSPRMEASGSEGPDQQR